MPKNFKKWANIAVLFLLCFSLIVNIHCVLLLCRYRQIYQTTPVWMTPTGEQMMVVPVVTPIPSVAPVTPSPEPTAEPVVEEVVETEAEVPVEEVIDAETVSEEATAFTEDVQPIQETETATETQVQEVVTPQVTEKPKATATPRATEKPQATKQPQAAVTSASSNLYITKSGSKYHREGCSSLSKSQIPISYEDAVAKGYEPCVRCNP